MSSTTTRSVQIRPLGKADIEQVIRLIGAQEFAQEHPHDVLRRLFDHPWAPDESDFGLVLTAGDKIVGALVAIYSRRTIDGQLHRFCNLGSWYIDPDYRRHSIPMLRTFMAREEYTLTSFSPAPHVCKLGEKLGWRPLGRNRLFWRRRFTSAFQIKRRVEVLSSPQAIEGLLTEEDRQILREHLPYACGHYLLTAKDRYCYIVTKRRPIKGQLFLPRWFPSRLRRRRFPVTDLISISNPALALRHWDSLLHQITRCESTIGLTVEESFLGPAVPPGAHKIPHDYYVYRLRTDPRHVNTLYTELVLLPV